MGVSTKAILFGNRSLDEVAAMVEAGYGVTVRVEGTPKDEWTLGRLSFPDKADPKNGRSLMVFAANIPDYRDVYDGERTLLHLSAWGEDEKIMRAVLERTGGFLSLGDNDFVAVPPKGDARDSLTALQRLTVEVAALVGPHAMEAIRPVLSDPDKLAALNDALTDFRASQEPSSPSP